MPTLPPGVPAGAGAWGRACGPPGGGACPRGAGGPRLASPQRAWCRPDHRTGPRGHSSPTGLGSAEVGDRQALGGWLLSGSDPPGFLLFSQVVPSPFSTVFPPLFSPGSLSGQAALLAPWWRVPVRVRAVEGVSVPAPCLCSSTHPRCPPLPAPGSALLSALAARPSREPVAWPALWSWPGAGCRSLCFRSQLRVTVCHLSVPLRVGEIKRQEAGEVLSAVLAEWARRPWWTCRGPPHPPAQLQEASHGRRAGSSPAHPRG